MGSAGSEPVSVKEFYDFCHFDEMLAFWSVSVCVEVKVRHLFFIA